MLSAERRALRLVHSQALSAIRLLARAVDAKDPSTQRHFRLFDAAAGDRGSVEA